MVVLAVKAEERQRALTDRLPSRRQNHQGGKGESCEARGIIQDWLNDCSWVIHWRVTLAGRRIRSMTLPATLPASNPPVNSSSDTGKTVLPNRDIGSLTAVTLNRTGLMAHRLYCSFSSIGTAQQAMFDVQVLLTAGHVLEISNFLIRAKSEIGMKKAGLLKPARSRFSRFMEILMSQDATHMMSSFVLFYGCFSKWKKLSHIRPFSKRSKNKWEPVRDPWSKKHFTF